MNFKYLNGFLNFYMTIREIVLTINIEKKIVKDLMILYPITAIGSKMGKLPIPTDIWKKSLTAIKRPIKTLVIPILPKTATCFQRLLIMGLYHLLIWLTQIGRAHV